MTDHQPMTLAPVNVLAVDPGATVGWASWYKPMIREPMVASGELSWDDFLVAFQARHAAGQLQVVVTERFEIGAETLTKSRQSEALYVIGGLVALSVLWRYEHVLQDRSVRRMITNERLQQLGWSNSTKGQHANDALRHLGAYLVTQSVDIGLFGGVASEPGR